MESLKITGIHPAAKLFPEPAAEEYAGLKQSIKEHGQRDPILIYKGRIVDGRSRAQVCKELKLEPRIEALDESLTDAQLHDISVDRNLHRRHLTAAQRRELVAKLLKAHPEQSNRQVAETAKADHKTVGAVRKEKEATGEIPQSAKTVGKDGRTRTATPTQTRGAARAARFAPGTQAWTLSDDKWTQVEVTEADGVKYRVKLPDGKVRSRTEDELRAERPLAAKSNTNGAAPTVYSEWTVQLQAIAKRLKQRKDMAEGEELTRFATAAYEFIATLHGIPGIHAAIDAAAHNG